MSVHFKDPFGEMCTFHPHRVGDFINLKIYFIL